MNRAQLEHIIRAACTIADDDELVIIGSQAILGQFPQAPADLLVSIEADVYPKHHPDKYVAGRDKDHRFTRVALAHGLADPATLRARLSTTPVDAEMRARIGKRIDIDCRA